MRVFILPAVAFGALALAACGGDRSAESQTATAEAEVETELPEEIITDAELQDLADRAAAGAGSATVPTDPAAGAGAPASGAAGTTPAPSGTAGGGETGNGATTPPAR